LQSVKEWLSYLESLHPKNIELGLDRVRKVAEKLNLTRLECQVVVVGGTNGKGSTIAMLEALLQAHGKRVACYTSPHLVHYNERVRCDQVVVSDEDLVASFAAIEAARDDVPLTYFEFGTLSAFYLIKQWRPDVALLEVGLGGRLDAVNIVQRDLSIITTIDLDHQDWLGDDLESIAAEKAGILIEHGTAVVGQNPLPKAVFDQAAHLNCTLRILGRDFKVSQDEGMEQQGRWSFVSDANLFHESLPVPKLPVNNAALAIDAASVLRVALDFGKTKQVMENITLAGRFSSLPGYSNVKIDVAHNPEAARYLAQQLTLYRQQHPGSRIFGVFSVLKDKDLMGIIVPLLPCIDLWYPASLSVPRGQPKQDLVEPLILAGAVVATTEAETVQAQFKCAVTNQHQDDLIVVFGSFFTVSAVLLKAEN
jgi:dihydrofolate synthase/folylpolyglutamate synthase